MPPRKRRAADEPADDDGEAPAPAADGQPPAAAEGAVPMLRRSARASKPVQEPKKRKVGDQVSLDAEFAAAPEDAAPAPADAETAAAAHVRSPAPHSAPRSSPRLNAGPRQAHAQSAQARVTSHESQVTSHERP